METTSLSSKIVELRKKAKISQKELAAILNISQNRISSFENDIGRPSNKIMKKIIEMSKEHGIVFTLEDMLNTRAGSKPREKLNS